MGSRKSNIKLGERFFQTIVRELQQSASHFSKGKREEARACYETAEQMIDTFLQETGLQEYLDNGSSNKEPVPLATLAAESKPATKSKGPAKKNPKGSGKRTPTSK